MAGSKATNAEIADRRERCVKYYLNTLPNFTQFIDWYLSAFDKKFNTGVTDWKWVVEHISTTGDTSISVKRWRRIAQLEQQYKDADNAKEKANIVMMAAKLEGVDVNRHEIEANINAPKSIFKIDLDSETTTEE